MPFSPTVGSPARVGCTSTLHHSNPAQSVVMNSIISGALGVMSAGGYIDGEVKFLVILIEEPLGSRITFD
jgi:hypothetical protein